MPFNWHQNVGGRERKSHGREVGDTVLPLLAVLGLVEEGEMEKEVQKEVVES